MTFKFSEKQILWGMILIYVAVFGLITALRHYNFQTQTWDLAAFVQSFWNAAHGRGLVNSLEQVPNHLGLHFSPFLFLLVPGYVIFQSPYFLLFIQTIAIALGAIPLYFLANRILNKRLLSHVIAIAYLLYPGLQWANMYDFHEITFFIPLFLAALYFIEVQKFGWAALFLALSASVKEDAILAVAFAGIYALLTAKSHPEAQSRMNLKRSFTEFILSQSNGFRMTNKSFGILIIVASVIYFVLAVKVFMPALGGGVLRLDRYANLGETPTAVVENIVKNPVILVDTILTKEKATYLFWLFLPVLFLPFFSWRSLILLLPGLPENLLTNYQFQFSGLYHYDSILIPGIFVGAIYGLKNILEKHSMTEKYLKWGFIGVIVGVFLSRSPLGITSFPVQYFQKNQQWEDYRQLIRFVPPEISVAANTNLVPHLAHREIIYQAGLEKDFVEMSILDAADLFPFTIKEEMQGYIDYYLATGNYTTNVLKGRYVIILNNKYKLDY